MTLNSILSNEKENKRREEMKGEKITYPSHKLEIDTCSLKTRA